MDSPSGHDDELYKAGIPIFNRHGTYLTREEREEMARRQGLCERCGIRVAKGRLRRKSITDQSVYKGICIKCFPSKVPGEALQEYERSKAAARPVVMDASSSSRTRGNTPVAGVAAPSHPARAIHSQSGSSPARNAGPPDQTTSTATQASTPHERLVGGTSVLAGRMDQTPQPRPLSGQIETEPPPSPMKEFQRDGDLPQAKGEVASGSSLTDSRLPRGKNRSPKQILQPRITRIAGGSRRRSRFVGSVPLDRLFLTSSNQSDDISSSLSLQFEPVVSDSVLQYQRRYSDVRHRRGRSWRSPSDSVDIVREHGLGIANSNEIVGSDDDGNRSFEGRRTTPRTTTTISEGSLVPVAEEIRVAVEKLALTTSVPALFAETALIKADYNTDNAERWILANRHTMNPADLTAALSNEPDPQLSQSKSFRKSREKVGLKGLLKRIGIRGRCKGISHKKSEFPDHKLEEENDEVGSVETAVDEITDSKYVSCGERKIFVRYVESIGKETVVKLFLNTCFITANNGNPIAQEAIQHDNSAATCCLENTNRFVTFDWDKDEDVIDCRSHEQKVVCLALCIHTTLKHPHYGDPNQDPNEIGYVILASNKKLIKPNMKLTETTRGDEENLQIVPSTDKNTTLRHLNFILNEICKDECIVLDKLLKERDSSDTKKPCNLNLENTSTSDDGCSAISSALHENSSITNLNLRVNEIGAAGCMNLANVLKQNKATSISYLNMGYNNIGNDGCIALFNALKYNTSLKELNLECNKIGKDACKAIGDALQDKENKTSLISLHLGKNKIEDNGCIAIFDALGKDETSLEELHLDGNGIGSCGACAAIGNALEENNSLVCLNLGINQIGDEGCICISDGLDSNRTLKTLCLKKNEIGDDGCEAILSAVQSNPDCALSNVDLSKNRGVSKHLMAYFQHQIAELSN